MSTMPGAVVIPKNYGESMVLYSAIERIAAVVDGARPGPNGRLFIIEPDKATKVSYEADGTVEIIFKVAGATILTIGIDSLLAVVVNK